MTFLAPFLGFAALLGIPILIFYLIREQPRRQLVSTLIFWEDLKSKVYETPLWRKLRRWVSLLLQLLFLAILVLAFAHPIGSWESHGTHPRVFVLDASASMSATESGSSRFENARQELKRAIRRMGPFEEAALVTTGTPPEILSGWTRSHRRLLEAADRAKPSALAQYPRDALALAKNLQTTRGDGEIAFFTDGVWDRALDAKFLEGMQVERFSSTPSNVGLTIFSARRSLVAPGEFSLLAEVQAAGPEERRGTVEIRRDGKLIDAQEITVSAKTPWRKTWNLQTEAATTFEARLVGFSDDRLGTDDHHSLQLEPLPKIDVSIVSPANSFLEAVFAAMPEVRVSRVWPADKAGEGDSGKLWIFDGAVPSPEFKARGLVLLAPRQGGFFGEVGGDMKDPLVTEVDDKSEVVRFASIDQVRAAQAVDIKPTSGADVFVSSLGRPLIFGRWSGQRPWIVIGFDMEKSDFVLRAAFPVLMENLVQSLRSSDEAPAPVPLPGSVTTRLEENPLPAKTLEPSRASLGDWLLRPLWWWLLAAALVWVFLEWIAYHRRITE